MVLILELPVAWGTQTRGDLPACLSMGCWSRCPELRWWCLLLVTLLMQPGPGSRPLLDLVA